MKKVILSVAVIAALGLTSCKNETKKETETTTTDSTAVCCDSTATICDSTCVAVDTATVAK